MQSLRLVGSRVHGECGRQGRPLVKPYNPCYCKARTLTVRYQSARVQIASLVCTPNGTNLVASLESPHQPNRRICDRRFAFYAMSIVRQKIFNEHSARFEYMLAFLRMAGIEADPRRQSQVAVIGKQIFERSRTAVYPCNIPWALTLANTSWGALWTPW
jgi:hypothetical protein